MENIITTSGLILIPGVSSSKKRSSPALAAGIGDSRFRLFSRAPDIVSDFLTSVDFTRAIKLWLAIPSKKAYREILALVYAKIPEISQNNAQQQNHDHDACYENKFAVAVDREDYDR